MSFSNEGRVSVDAADVMAAIAEVMERESAEEFGVRKNPALLAQTNNCSFELIWFDLVTCRVFPFLL